MNTAGHYTVEENSYLVWQVTGRSVRAIRCKHCNYATRPAEFKQRGDRSGLPQYSRARAAMVKHLHAEHRDSLNQAEGR